MKASDDIVIAFKESLPKPRRWTFVEISLAFSSFASLVLSVAAFVASDTSTKTYVAVGALSLTILVLIFYTVIRETRGLHRYAQAILHLHFAAHITRDVCASSNGSGVEAGTRALLNSAAQIFSIVTGKSCSVSVKLLKADDDDNMFIDTVLRDQISSTKSNDVNRYSIDQGRREHWSIAKNYRSIWSLVTGRVARFYLSKDIFSDFVGKRYMHPALIDPSTDEELAIERDIFGRIKCPGWPLEFRSTLVVPIRVATDSTERTPKIYKYLGFLCIDCNSRDVFDSRFSPDLASVYADLLYLLFQFARSLPSSKVALASSKELQHTGGVSEVA